MTLSQRITAGGTHGNNERISIESINKGTAVMLELVSSMVRAPGLVPQADGAFRR